MASARAHTFTRRYIKQFKYNVSRDAANRTRSFRTAYDNALYCASRRRDTLGSFVRPRNDNSTLERSSITWMTNVNNEVNVGILLNSPALKINRPPSGKRISFLTYRPRFFSFSLLPFFPFSSFFSLVVVSVYEINSIKATLRNYFWKFTPGPLWNWN